MHKVRISFNALERLINIHNPFNLEEFLKDYNWTIAEYHQKVLLEDADFLDTICFFDDK